MYLTVSQMSEYLTIPETEIIKLVQAGKIRAVFDGEQFVINKDQFSTHLKQMEQYKEMITDYLNEPIPEDLDVRDED